VHDLCGPCVKAEIGEGYLGALKGARGDFPFICGYQLRMTATGRAIRFIVLISLRRRSFSAEKICPHSI